MNDKHHKLISDSAIDMYESLRISIEQAGGHIHKEELMNMTVDELISRLCTNNVRFTFVEPKYKEEIPSNFIEYSTSKTKDCLCPKCKTFGNHHILIKSEKWKYACYNCKTLFGIKECIEPTFVEPKYKGEYKQEVKLTDEEFLFTERFTERKLLKEIEHNKETIQIQSQTIKDQREKLEEIEHEYDKLLETYQDYKCENATAVAKSIVNYLYKNCFYNKFEGDEEFEPLNDLYGLLLQLSIMVTGVTSKEKAQKTIDLLYAAEQENKKLKNRIFNMERKIKGDIQ